MRVLLDTGILLRVLHATDPRHAVIRAAINRLELDGHTVACGIQNIAEFWNVTTRPSTTRGGFGQSLQMAEQRLAVLERLVAVLAESVAFYAECRRLVVQHRVSACKFTPHDS